MTVTTNDTGVRRSSHKAKPKSDLAHSVTIIAAWLYLLSVIVSGSNEHGGREIALSVNSGTRIAAICLSVLTTVRYFYNVRLGQHLTGRMAAQNPR